jgi:hypothetical protein
MIGCFVMKIELINQAEVTDLKWETYMVRAVKMILAKAEHSDGEEKEEGIRRDAKQQPNDWVPIPGGHPLRRWGCLAEMMSISPLTMPMYGPMHNGALLLEQFLDMPEDQPDPVRQSEVPSLSPPLLSSPLSNYHLDRGM